MKQDKIYILWTGGWDSTFMLIQELRNGKVVQPVYIVDKDRRSLKYEKRAMQRIAEKLKKKNYGGILLPTEFIDRDVIPEDKEVTEAYRIVYEKTGLGEQHEWIARYAKWKNVDLALGHEKGITASDRLTKTMKLYTKVEQLEDGTFIINSEGSTDEGRALLGRMIFPIMRYRETDMAKKVKEWEVEDVMKEIWFCHTPTRSGEACGFCHPCVVKMESGMEFLLSDKAKRRYNYYVSHRKRGAIQRKIANAILKVRLLFDW